MKHVLLIAEKVFTPYAAGEVFGWPVEEAKELIAKAEGKIRLYDEKRDAEHLAAMNGKQAEAGPAEISVVKVDPKTFEPVSAPVSTPVAPAKADKA